MALSKLARQRYDRQRRAAGGAVTRDYDSVADRYDLQPSQLANLEVRRAAIRSAASERRGAIQRYLDKGMSVADIVLISGISRAAVYRLMESSAKRAYSLKQRKYTDPLLL